MVPMLIANMQTGGSHEGGLDRDPQRAPGVCMIDCFIILYYLRIQDFVSEHNIYRQKVYMHVCSNGICTMMHDYLYLFMSPAGDVPVRQGA